MIRGNTIQISCCNGTSFIPSGMIDTWSVYKEMKDDKLSLDCKIEDLADLIEHQILIKRCGQIKLLNDVVLYARKYGVPSILKHIRSYMFKYVDGMHPIRRKYRDTMFHRSNIEEVKLAITEQINHADGKNIFRKLSSITDESVNRELIIYTMELIYKYTLDQIVGCEVSITDGKIKFIPENRNEFNKHIHKIYVESRLYLKKYKEYTHLDDYLIPESKPSMNNFHPFLLAMFDDLTNTNAVDSNGKKCVLRKHPLIGITKISHSNEIGITVCYGNESPKFIEWNTINDYSFDPDISTPEIALQNDSMKYFIRP